MGMFTNGLIVGVGVVLLVAPMRGEEMRRLVRERVSSIRASLPTGGQGSDTLSQTANVLKDNTQQAAAQVQPTGSALANTAQQAATEVKQASKNAVETTKQTARSTQPKTSGTSTSL